ncbi:MAG: Uncharacterized protein FD135_4065 [Comamonadaceae bacterium]|nr:MAG: Uncharacterized protein FD135_4065 [Comamonadaceae bacterium]
MLTATPIHHMHDAKTPPDDEGPAKQALDLLRRGIGGHIKVFRGQAQHQVAHRAADDIGLKTSLFERAHHVDGAFVHQFGVDAVVCRPDFQAFAKTGFGGCIRLAEQLVDEFFDHCGCPEGLFMRVNAAF